MATWSGDTALNARRLSGSFTLSQLYGRDTAPWKMGRPSSQSGCCGDKQFLLLLRGIQPLYLGHSDLGLVSNMYWSYYDCFALSLCSFVPKN